MKKPKTGEVTSVNRWDIFSGWLNHLVNPDALLRDKGKSLALYDDVNKDAHASAVLQSRYLAVVSKKWTIEPADETDKAKEIAKFVEDVLRNTNFMQARQELLEAILYGFYVVEIIWKIDGNKVTVDKLRAKHPVRFTFTKEREMRLLTFQAPYEGIKLPERKFIRFTYGSSNNPYGKGLGQKLWWPVWFKKNGLKFWLTFLEKYGAPTAVGKYPPGTDTETQNKLLDALDAIQTETGIKIPDTMVIELLEAKRQGVATYEELCNYLDRQITKAVLGQTATTEGTAGKLGNEKAQNETRQDIVEADTALLDECLNKSLIPWVVDYNFPEPLYPRIKTHAERGEDLKARAERDKILVADIGVPVANEYFYEAYNLPRPKEGESQPTPRQKPMFSEIDNLTHEASKKSDMEILLKPVMRMINKASSLEEIGQTIYALYPQLDTKRFQELLTRAMFYAAMTGYGEKK